ncbi:MAG: hypothetical protein DME07_04210 [Candidatus Rokuibacteriota bacterium]|nr:MAG: hypothetical protein DME07_04210 [Candidatus Rokubacteria bacterium]
MAVVSTRATRSTTTASVARQPGAPPTKRMRCVRGSASRAGGPRSACAPSRPVRSSSTRRIVASSSSCWNGFVR